jgi:glycosyltransferase involved in cell wall biosynthesis
MDQSPGVTHWRVAYFFTRFPHPTETFLQREVRAMRRLGLQPILFSWHRGAAVFDDLPVRRFSKWRLLTLPWCALREWWLHPAEITALTRQLFRGWPADWMNYWENLYGAGIAAVVAPEFRRAGFHHVHAVWASLPAMVAWALSRMTGVPFSLGAHAYDVFEHGGDWFLREKCAAAKFVHTSTEAARQRLREIGIADDCLLLARRGLDSLPAMKPPRALRTPLRIVCVARLVEKKGLHRQLALYRFCRDAGLKFTARLIGDGPLRGSLRAAIRAWRLDDCVTLCGAMPIEAVWAELAAADVLVHTGVITASGDRDGLPNVVPEAMCAGTIVITAPGAGVLEAVRPEVTGLVCPLEDPRAWREAFARVQRDDDLVARLQSAARGWAERNYDGVKNAGKILARFASSVH